ncbi:hypothetical protein MXB_1960, partial [Myxobolus squamalis]
ERTHLIKNIFTDATISLGLTFLSQIYVIIIVKGGFLLQVLYVLLPNKEGRAYRRLIELNLKPLSILIDFERNSIGADRTTFLNCSIYGHLFLLTTDLRRKLQDEGLLRRYNTDHDFALVTRI